MHKIDNYGYITVYTEFIVNHQNKIVFSILSSVLAKKSKN